MVHWHQHRVELTKIKHRGDLGLFTFKILFNNLKQADKKQANKMNEYVKLSSIQT